MHSTGEEVKHTTKQAAFSPLMETLTRVGFFTRGLIYVIIGVLAFLAAIGKKGQLTSPQNAIGTIGQQPAGQLLLWVVFLGLISYALWGLIRAGLDPLHRGKRIKGLLTRLGYFVSALSYAFLAYIAYGYLNGKLQSSGSQTKFLSTLVTQPWGRYVIIAIGLIILGVGIYNFSRGINNKFERQFSTYRLTRNQAQIINLIGRFGTSARGVVFAIVGFLIIMAGYTANPNKPVGVDAALAWILQQPFGTGLLAIIALGLVAFGVYSILSALWFRMRASMD